MIISTLFYIHHCTQLSTILNDCLFPPEYTKASAEYSSLNPFWKNTLHIHQKIVSILPSVKCAMGLVLSYVMNPTSKGKIQGHEYIHFKNKNEILRTKKDKTIYLNTFLV